MRLGYAHQATGGLAVAQAVKELVSGARKEIRLVIARQPSGGLLPRLFGVHDIVLETCRGSCFRKQIRTREGGDGSHMLVGFGPDEDPCPIVVAAVVTEFLTSERARYPAADVFRPLDQINPEHPVVGEFEV